VSAALESFVIRFSYLAALSFMFCTFIAAGETSTSTDTKKPEKPTEFRDDGARCYFKIPDGYTQMTEEEIREIIRVNGAVLGKEISEQILRQPPVLFRGPTDPAKAKDSPPVLRIEVYGLKSDDPVDPAKVQEYKSQYEESVRKHGERIGEVSASIVSVNGTNAIRFEHELFDRMDNSRRHLILLSIPGPSRRFVFVFNYSTDQEAGVHEAAETITKSFKVLDEVLATPESKNKWLRIALWTLGGLVAGLLLGMLLSMLTGKNQPAPSKT
jgi:hypothetical protein